MLSFGNNFLYRQSDSFMSLTIPFLNILIFVWLSKKSERILRVIKVLIELKDFNGKNNFFENIQKWRKIKKKKVNNLDGDILLNMETLQIEIKFGEWRIWIRICAFNIGDGLKIFLEIGGCFHWPREMNNSSSM